MSETWLTILLAGAGTFTMRAAFLAGAHRMVMLPQSVQRLLRQIPPAALASIVAPALLQPNGELDLWQAELAAGLLAGAVAWKTRNVALTLLMGMGALAALRAV